MKFSDKLEGNVAVFELSGKIMGGEATTMFHGRIRENVNNHIKSVVIDLKDVVWINSVGLGMLISALTTIRTAGGRLVLANITAVESLLSLTRLITVFEIYDSQKAAVESFD
ncbi:MAG: STAS domain-containing protein [bacterium]